MKKFINLLICAILSHFAVSAQITYNPSVQSQNNRGKILSVNITNNETIIKIQFPRGGTHSISSATVLVPCDAWNISDARSSNLAWPPAEQALVSASLYARNRQIVEEGRMALSNDGFLIRSLGNDKLDTYYKPSQGADYMVLELHFDKLNPGEDNVYIREIIGDTGYEWYGIKINNPFPITPTTGYNEFSIKKKIDEQNDGVVGIYEQIGVTNYKLGCIKDGEKYKLVYLGSRENFRQWRIGDLKSVLHFTAIPYLFKADYYILNKTREEVYVVFDGQSMKITFEDGSATTYLKMYPTASPSGNNTSEESADWSGTGFALNNGYICTNYHVIDGAKSIEIRGIQGDFTTSYSAKAVASDKFNDLSILKIDDENFKGFGPIPYNIKTSMADVGEEIFVLGYPMTATMGDEIKLTTGVVSSRTGFQGDVSLYQISAPIQPGNSGGPLFDSQGNLIGIISAKHKGAENVGYAIKASYLKNLMESSLIEDILPINNTISSLPLTGKVQKVKNYVYFIKCSSKSNSISTNNNHDISSYTDEDDMTYYSSNTISDSTGTRVNATAYKIPDTYESEAESDNSEALISSGMKLAMEDSVHYTPDKDTVNNPYVKTVIDKMAIIKRVIRKDDFTAVEISIKRGKRQWCNINEDTYIEADGIRYTMTCADGIATAPEKTYFPYTEDSVTFTLFFPPIPKSAVSMHLIESTYSDFRFYGIQLR